jgi:CelD/BcsL family acetyltransferase involved in cellulose biosynthesis
LDIRVIRPEELSPAQIARWEALQATRADLGSPFLSPHWVRAVAVAQGDDNVRVAAVGPPGEEAAFFSARVGRFTAQPVGAPMCDYQGVVSDKGVRLDARELVRAFGVQSFDYGEMLAYDSTFATHSRGRAMSHIVNVPDGYAAYEAQRKEAGVGVLKDADKKRRKAEREVGPARVTIFSRDEADFEQMVAWKRAQFSATGQIDIFETPWTLRLLRDLFEHPRPGFGGMLCTLHFGDQLAAAQFHLHGADVVHGWFITHNPEFERYSPGILMFQDILRWMDGAPFSRLDLGCGDYRFKRELANAGQWVSHGFVGKPAAPAMLARRAAYGAIRAAEALPLGQVSFLPGKALRRIDRWRSLR